MKTRKIEKFILHNSDSNIKSHDDISVIDDWHAARGFKWVDEDGTERHVGYHYFIKSDGTVQTGRPEYKVGAHVKDMNTHSIGICLHGKEETDFTDAQFKSLATLLQELGQRYTTATIHGHNEFSSKRCPVFDVDDFIEDYMSNIDEIQIKG